MSQDLTASIYNESWFVYWPPFSISLEDVYIGILTIMLYANYLHYEKYFEAPYQLESSDEKIHRRMEMDRDGLLIVFGHSFQEYNRSWNAIVNFKQQRQITLILKLYFFNFN